MNNPLEPVFTRGLEIASRIEHPTAVVCFAIVFFVIVYWRTPRTKNREVARSFRIAAFVILVAGLAPTAANTYLHSQGVYRIRVTVIGPDQRVRSDAKLTSSLGGEVKSSGNTWEIDIPPQSRPNDGRLTISAEVGPEFLLGSRTVTLGNDYFPSLTIQLSALPSTPVRGIVLDERGGPVSSAKVAIENYPEITLTNSMGNFEIQSHVPAGKMISIIATKGSLVAKISGPAGDGFEVVLRK